MTDSIKAVGVNEDITSSDVASLESVVPEVAVDAPVATPAADPASKPDAPKAPKVEVPKEPLLHPPLPFPFVGTAA